MKSKTSFFCSVVKSVCSIAEASDWKNSSVPAMLRLWSSSPMWRAWASMERRSISPVISTACLSIGPKTSRIHTRRSMTDWSFAPIRRILASCSERLV